MASDKTIASVYNALGILFGSAAFGLGISSITSNYWRNGVILNLENTHVGLWNLCFSKNICVEVPYDPYLDATRAFMILSVIFLFFAGLGNIASQWKSSRQIRIISSGLYSIAGVFAMIGAAVYTSLGPYGKSGLGFIFAWVVVGLSYFAGILQNLSAQKMEK